MPPVHVKVPPSKTAPAGVCWQQWHGTTPPVTIDPLEHCTRPAGHGGLHTFEDHTEIARRRILSALAGAGIGLESSHVRVALLIIYVEETQRRG